LDEAHRLVHRHVVDEQIGNAFAEPIEVTAVLAEGIVVEAEYCNDGPIGLRPRHRGGREHRGGERPLRERQGTSHCLLPRLWFTPPGSCLPRPLRFRAGCRVAPLARGIGARACPPHHPRARACGGTTPTAPPWPRAPALRPRRTSNG